MKCQLIYIAIMVACLPSQAEGVNRENPASSSNQESIPQQTCSEVKRAIGSSWSPPSWFTLQILDTEYSMWASLQCISVDASYILSVLFLWGTDTGAHQGLLFRKLCSHFNKRHFAYQAPWAWGTLFARPTFPAAGQSGIFAPLSGLHHALQETWLWCRREHLVRVCFL